MRSNRSTTIIKNYSFSDQYKDDYSALFSISDFDFTIGADKRYIFFYNLRITTLQVSFSYLSLIYCHSTRTNSCNIAGMRLTKTFATASLLTEIGGIANGYGIDLTVFRNFTGWKLIGEAHLRDFLDCNGPSLLDISLS